MEKMERKSKYEGVEDDNFFDLSNQQLGAKGLVELFTDLHNDTTLKHIDLSYNITLDEAAQPIRMAKMNDELQKLLLTNKTLTALDMAGNHLGNFGPHPLNEQKYDFFVKLASYLHASPIRRIDLSDNLICGELGRKMLGLSKLVQWMGKYGLAFSARSSKLRGQALMMISD